MAAKKAAPRQREGGGSELCQAAAAALRLTALAAHCVAVLGLLAERALERAARVLLETVAEEAR